MPNRKTIDPKRQASLSLALVLAVYALPVLWNHSTAQASDQRYFSSKDLFSLDKLPASQFRDKIEKLSPQAQTRATRWLRRFSFSTLDLPYLRTDELGSVFYEEPVADAQPTSFAQRLSTWAAQIESQNSLNESDALSTATVSPSTVFKLHSKPGAQHVVYLDMDGHELSGSAWNRSAGVDTLYMRPYDIDGDPDNVSNQEAKNIAETWKRVSEDYAPFDIDVTTEEPDVLGPSVGHILVSPQIDEIGSRIYPNPAGGVAYVGVWGFSNYTYYQPALVFPEYLGGEPKKMAEAGSHELGHHLGLSHDGDSQSAYYHGHGSGDTDWAPIMGLSYTANVTQWSKGEYTDANNQEDDIAIIASRLNYLPDDHTDFDFSLATPLVLTGDTLVTSTTPVDDPENLNPANKGILGDRNDVDMFYFDMGAGTVEIKVKPDWTAHYVDQDYRSANLDIQLEFYNTWGDRVGKAKNWQDATQIRIRRELPAGRYYVLVSGVGYKTPEDGYSDYATIGRYFISGSIPVSMSEVADPRAPVSLSANLSVGGDGVVLNWERIFHLDGYLVYRSKDSGPWAQIDRIPAWRTDYTDSNLASGSYSYFLLPYNRAGHSKSNVTDPISIMSPNRTFASTESHYLGEVISGSVFNTQDTGSSQLLGSASEDAGQVSATGLEHAWHFDQLEPGAKVELEIDTLAEGEDYEFSYQLNQEEPVEIGLLEGSTGRQTLRAALPTDASGQLTVRVRNSPNSGYEQSPHTLEVFGLAVNSSGKAE